MRTGPALPRHYEPGHFADLLSRELARVADTPGTRGHAVFGQALRLVRDNGLRLRGNGPYAPLIAYGWQGLNASTYRLSKVVGFQPELAATVLTAGDGGRLAARLTGDFDAADIGRKVRRLGARMDHGAWRLARTATPTSPPRSAAASPPSPIR